MSNDVMRLAIVDLKANECNLLCQEHAHKLEYMRHGSVETVNLLTQLRRRHSTSKTYLSAICHTIAYADSSLQSYSILGKNFIHISCLMMCREYPNRDSLAGMLLIKSSLCCYLLNVFPF